MPVRRTPFVGGNWKMNLLAAEVVALAQSIAAPGGGDGGAGGVDVVVFPPFPYLATVRPVLKPGVQLGGQDCSADAATRTRLARNRYVSPTGAVKECGKTLAAWQALDPAANDPGSVAEAYPADIATAAITWARALLGL
jgi:hypothetical protein